ncbi:hypothetical protein [Desulfobulbus alkaliphilus]|uniref:hypothetical protein n=1 Tax=Desulfobulbus alkaliphilus TaxID=869814 RepID=UPI0019662318|nr:hypothetical protein [Desulfobulbus alkaliphilus]MBM9538368.1 hypothetical protein [Desulfobulbus alkaliphilus]
MGDIFSSSSHKLFRPQGGILQGWYNDQHLWILSTLTQKTTNFPAEKRLAWLTPDSASVPKKYKYLLLSWLRLYNGLNPHYIEDQYKFLPLQTPQAATTHALSRKISHLPNTRR